MPTKEKLVEVARRRARRILTNLGEELLEARHQCGLSQSEVARVAGISRSQVSRIERGMSPMLSIDLASRLLASVGLELSARAYPRGEPMRDAAQLALLMRFEELVPRHLPRRHEAPLPGFGEQRAWDLVLDAAGGSLAVEAETHVRDVQGLLRRLSSKKRDDRRVCALILVLADTRHNRDLLDQFGAIVRADLPCHRTEILAALRNGSLPPGDGLLVL